MHCTECSFVVLHVLITGCREQRCSRGHKARGRGQGHKKIPRPRPRTEPVEAKAKNQGHRSKCSPKKRVFKKFFWRSQKKGLQKIFFRRSPLEENKKRHRKIFGVFQQNFSVQKIVLSSSRGLDNFRGLEASRPRPRASKCVLEDVLEVKNVLEESTSGREHGRL